MAKKKMYCVIVDRTVDVELKDKPKITYPAGWRGEVDGATLKVIKSMEAGREVAADGGAVAGDDPTDAEIKAKHDAADKEAAKILKEARDKSVEMLDAAKEQSEQMVADAEARVKEINAGAAPTAGKPDA